jgi:flagellar assembly factor FliW
MPMQANVRLSGTIGAVPGVEPDSMFGSGLGLGFGLGFGSDSGTESGLPEITFVRPIPGFAGLKRFVLTSLADANSPICELRSLERPEVRFVVAMPGAFFSDYEIELDDQECDTLGLAEVSDALILTVLTPGEDAASTTANLLAPMVINSRTRDAAQVILTGSDWPVRAALG